MLPKAGRLAKVRDFNILMKHGRWIRGNFLDIKYLKLKEITSHFPQKEDYDSFEKQLKFAISVGLRVSKRAVNRNALKRQIGEALRSLVKSGLVKNGYYIMVVAKKRGLGGKYAEISQELTLLLRRAGVLC